MISAGDFPWEDFTCIHDTQTTVYAGEQEHRREMGDGFK